MATVADYAVLRTETVHLADPFVPGSLRELEVPWQIPENFVVGKNLARPILTLDVAIIEETKLTVKMKEGVIFSGTFAKGFFGQHHEPFTFPTTFSFSFSNALRFQPSGGPMRLRYVIMWHQVTVSD